MKKYAVLVVLALGLCSDLIAGEQKVFPPISFVLPGTSGPTVSKDKIVSIVVEPGFISHEETPIPKDGVVAYVDSVLKAKGASYVGVYVREGAKYGDLLKALDLLRQSSATSIGVSMIELPVGRQP